MKRCAICREPITPGSGSYLSEDLASRILFRLGNRHAHSACEQAAARTLTGEHPICRIEPKRRHGILDLEVVIF